MSVTRVLDIVGLMNVLAVWCGSDESLRMIAKEIPMPFNPESVSLMNRLAAKARAEVARRRESPEDKMSASIASTETTGAAFACGVANGRHGGERGEMTIGPTFPADLAAGVALHGAAALLGHDSEPEPHLAALGTGALAGCAYRYGERLGRSTREAAHAQQHRALPAAAQPPALPSPQPVGETFTVIELPPRARRP
jgi:hypothetical protein